jgi:hypothetical protein
MTEVAAGEALTFCGMDWTGLASFSLKRMAHRPPAKTKIPAQAPSAIYFMFWLKMLIMSPPYHIAYIIPVFDRIAIPFDDALQQSYKFVTFCYPSRWFYDMLLP